MALSKTHATTLLLSILRNNENTLDEAISEWDRLLAYALLPDAIRCFSFGEGIKNNRVVSHGEINPATGEASWMRMPSVAQIKELNEDIIASLDKYYAGEYNQVAIGDETSIEAFIKHNLGIDSIVYLGCLIHLTQDCIYDAYIREVIDCSHRRENGEFYFDGEVYDAKSVRTLISQIEEIEFRTLCKMVKEEFAIKVDQSFFEEHVKSVLERDYCERMAASTWKYISFSDDEVPQHITEDMARSIMNKMVLATQELL